MERYLAAIQAEQIQRLLALKKRQQLKPFIEFNRGKI
jgi:hypothetical protein